MPKVSLTASIVANTHCPKGKHKLNLFDAQTKGLLLEVREHGRTYYLRYQSERGATRQLRLADARDVSLSQARQLADRARNQIAMGDDPAEAKAVKRQALV